MWLRCSVVAGMIVLPLLSKKSDNCSIQHPKIEGIMMNDEYLLKMVPHVYVLPLDFSNLIIILYQDSDFTFPSCIL